MYVCFYANRFVLCVRREYTHYTENSIATAKANSKAYWMCVVCVYAESTSRNIKKAEQRKGKQRGKSSLPLLWTNTSGVAAAAAAEAARFIPNGAKIEEKKNSDEGDGGRRKADCQAWTIWDEEELLSVTAYYISAFNHEQMKTKFLNWFG